MIPVVELLPCAEGVVISTLRLFAYFHRRTKVGQRNSLSFPCLRANETSTRRDAVCPGSRGGWVRTKDDFGRLICLTLEPVPGPPGSPACSGCPLQARGTRLSHSPWRGLLLGTGWPTCPPPSLVSSETQRRTWMGKYSKTRGCNRNVLSDAR